MKKSFHFKFLLHFYRPYKIKFTIKLSSADFFNFLIITCCKMSSSILLLALFSTLMLLAAIANSMPMDTSDSPMPSMPSSSAPSSNDEMMSTSGMVAHDGTTMGSDAPGISTMSDATMHALMPGTTEEPAAAGTSLGPSMSDATSSSDIGMTMQPMTAEASTADADAMVTTTSH